jgi:hypothetical protein
MVAIPAFDDAMADFGSFLARRGHPTTVTWLFRDEIWARTRERLLVRWPLPSETPALAKKVYGEGQERGIVGLRAIGQTRQMVFATVWYPKLPEDAVQGWSENLKLSIAEPLARVRRVPGALWVLVRRTPSYRRYQRWESQVGTRKWAAS